MKSPVLASVTAARPICRPVRREVLSTSGVSRRICSTCCEDAVGLGERAAGGHDVVEDEAAFVHLGQQVGAERVVAEVCADDEQDADAGERRADGPAPSRASAREQWRTRRMMRPFSSWLSAACGCGSDRRRASPCRCGLFGFAQQVSERAGVQVSASSKRGEQRSRHGDGERAEEAAGDSGDGDERQKDDDRGDGRDRRAAW